MPPLRKRPNAPKVGLYSSQQQAASKSRVRKLLGLMRKHQSLCLSVGVGGKSVRPNREAAHWRQPDILE
jgi:hypothetical protein